MTRYGCVTGRSRAPGFMYNRTARPPGEAEPYFLRLPLPPGGAPPGAAPDAAAAAAAAALGFAAGVAAPWVPGAALAATRAPRSASMSRSRTQAIFAAM